MELPGLMNQKQMSMLEILRDERINNVIEDYRLNLEEILKVGYNLFTLSTRNYHYENFHSDIIASLLQPNGLHNEGRLFIDRFMMFLADRHGIDVAPEDFGTPVVTREKDRLDILIHNNETINKAIIIENKINEACDQEDQLPRYYNSCKEEGFSVKAILYLSLRGLRHPPAMDIEETVKLMRIAAFSGDNDDFITGWLEPCIESCTNYETRALLIQYSKLLKHLAYRSMEKKTMDEFYTIVNDDGNLKKIQDLNALYDRIPEYRLDNFVAAIKDFSPFQKLYRVNNTYIAFESFVDGDDVYRLEIEILKNGSVWAGLWNTAKNNFGDNSSLTKMVKQLPAELKLTPKPDHSWYTRNFTLDEYETMANTDKALISFVKVMLDALNKTKRP